VGSDVEVAALLETARLELHDGQPPTMIAAPEARLAHAPKAERVKHPLGGNGYDLVMDFGHA
jgi:hypothetical protein